ncbi:CLUMA_CG017682, isoform A [Clunio marinus]|uniref:CLUMA_CG017682, isoform A n=1 Tax=Clunio marinus TaxID=568069 RepID=A0A1J1IZL9_9DIPT|nr:CLUMA_CG017682, isoform A [Clunio marinus]
MAKLIIALSFLLIVSNVSAFWGPCAGVPSPEWITSQQCDAVRCTVSRGGTLIAQAQYTSPRSHNELIVRFTAFLLGLPVFLPIPPGFEDACTQLADGITCPTPANFPIIWNMNAPIPTTVPAFNNAPVRVELLENNQSVVCAMVTATIL